LPKLVIKKNLQLLTDLEKLEHDDFELEGYDPHPVIPAKLFAGVK